MKTKNTIYIVLLMTISFALNSFNVNAQGTWTTYTTADGLANSDVRAIIEDHNNNLWFGTEYRVSKLIINTGIAEQENTQPIINFYPNPNNGLFTFEREKDDLNITILNVNGQVIYSKQFEKRTPHTVEHIDLSNQAKGLYFVKIQSLKTTKVGKLIIQ